MLGQDRCRTEKSQAELGQTMAVQGRTETGSMRQSLMEYRVTDSQLGRVRARSVQAKQSGAGRKEGHHGAGPEQDKQQDQGQCGMGRGKAIEFQSGARVVQAEDTGR